MSGRNEPRASSCRWCDESFTAAGIKNHETYCDENPNPGISYEQQVELGLLDDEETGTADADTNPHQEVSSSESGLPPRSTVQGGDKVRQAVTDGSGSEEVDCPSCGSSNTLDSTDARREYEEQTENPVAGVVLAFNLSDRYCEECFTLWGDEFPEPVGIDEAVGAAGGGS